MTRATLTTANRTETGKPALREAYFVEVAFPGGTIRANSGDRMIPWGGYDWPARLLLQPADVMEKPDLKPYRAELLFSGVDSALVDKILNENYSQARVGQWTSYFDENWKLVGDPHEVAPQMLLSNAVLALDQGTGVISLSAEGPEIFWSRDSAQLATPESQRLRHPTDTGMDRVLAMNTLEMEWGGVYASYTGAGGGSRQPNAGERLK